MSNPIPIKEGAARVLLAEGVLTLRVAAMCLPPRNGYKFTATNLRDLSERGYCGVRLEVVELGGELCTSRPALARFINRVEERLEAGDPPKRRRKVGRG